MPKEIAGRAQLYYYYARKDYKRLFNYVIGIYVDLTGADKLPNLWLVGAVAALVLYCVVKSMVVVLRGCCKCRRCCRCCACCACCKAFKWFETTKDKTI